MKRITLSLCLVIFALQLLSQNDPPVAVNDTAYGMAGELITINVIENDYDPDGDPIKIKEANQCYSYTDSTITLFYNIMEYGGCNTTVQQSYTIEDIHGNSDPGSIGIISIILSPGLANEDLDTNNIRARFWPLGTHFLDLCYAEYSGPHFEYPKGSGKGTIYTSSLWVGGIDANSNLHLAGERFMQIGSDYWPGPLSNDGFAYTDSLTSWSWNKIWKISIDEIRYHSQHWNDAGYQPIQAIADWPAHGDTSLNQDYYLAPFIDNDGDGNYNPLNGDMPWIRGDQFVFFIFNDQKEHSETAGLPIGIEVHGMAYSFNTPGSEAFQNTIFLSYKIINRSNNEINDAYIGIFNDLDIGGAWDDFVGCDVTRGAFYGFNGDDEDDDYGTNIPAQGVVVLGGPLMDADNIDNPAGQCDESVNGVGFGDSIVDNERYGMNRFLYFLNSGAPQGDPQIAQEYYYYLKGIWTDETVMEYGGNGHAASGAYGPACKFMFPGTSDPCNWGTDEITPFGPVDWTEFSAGNTPGDRRVVCSMGPFTLEAGGYYNIDLAYVTAEDGDPQSSVDLLKDYIDEIKNEYYQNSDFFGFMPLAIDDNNEIKENDILVWPNPSNRILNVKTGSFAGTEFRIVDMYGRTVQNGSLEKGIVNTLSVHKLNYGVYILQLIGNDEVRNIKFLKQ